MEVIHVIIEQGPESPEGRDTYIARLYDTSGRERAVLGPFDTADQAEQAARATFGGY